MTDLEKRRSLRTVSLAMAATVAGTTTWLLATTTTASASVEVSLRYAPNSDYDTLILRNSGERQVAINIEFPQQLEVPGGKLDNHNLSVAGPISIEPGANRTIRLVKNRSLDRSISLDNSDSHGVLRFPVPENVVLGNVLVTELQTGASHLVPITLSKA